MKEKDFKSTIEQIFPYYPDLLKWLIVHTVKFTNVAYRATVCKTVMHCSKMRLSVAQIEYIVKLNTFIWQALKIVLKI